MPVMALLFHTEGRFQQFGKRRASYKMGAFGKCETVVRMLNRPLFLSLDAIFRHGPCHSVLVSEITLVSTHKPMFALGQQTPHSLPLLLLLFSVLPT